jgi:predicted ester cyclase
MTNILSPQKKYRIFVLVVFNFFIKKPMITRISLVLALFLVLATGCMKKNGAADNGGMSTADSMKAAYTALSAAWDAGKVDEFDKYISANSVDHSMMQGQEPGLAGMKKMAAAMKVGFPDEKTTIEGMYVDSNILVARFTMNATNSGSMMGMPPTNKQITGVMGIEMMRWENGKFVEHWGLLDQHAMMSQLGLMPPHPMPSDSTMTGKQNM